MKILFWTDGFWPRIGGIETQALRFVESLLENGHVPFVIAQLDPQQPEEETYRNIPIKRFDFKGIIESKALNQLSKIEAYLNKLIQHFAPDIVHLNQCIGTSSFVFSIFRRKFHMPVILTVHSPLYYQKPPFSLVEKICLQVDAICCVSKWVLRELEKLVPQVKEKLHLIYNGLPLPKIPPSPLHFFPPILLVVGRLSIEKGFDTAIQALAHLKKRRPDARLRIIGNGFEESRLRQLTKDLHLSESVEFVGSISMDHIPTFINQASIVLVPSYFESFGLVALEALQMERPVIASNVGGLPEIVSHGETGLLVPPHDPIALAHAIEEILTHPEEGIRMGKEGRNRALDFSQQKNLRQYEKVYEHFALV